MNTLPKSSSLCLALAVAAGLAASVESTHAQGAIATISDVSAGGGNFDYTIILQNTGSTSLNSFWYGWTTAGNNLPSDPSSAGNTLGWADNLDANSIQFENTTSSSALAPGQSATFTFVTTDTLSAITTAPSGESVAFDSDTIQFNQGVAGKSTPVFSPTIGSVPEPSTYGLLGAGLLGLAGSFRSLKASRGLRQTK